MNDVNNRKILFKLFHDLNMDFSFLLFVNPIISDSCPFSFFVGDGHIRKGRAMRLCLSILKFVFYLSLKLSLESCQTDQTEAKKYEEARLRDGSSDVD